MTKTLPSSLALAAALLLSAAACSDDDKKSSDDKRDSGAGETDAGTDAGGGGADGGSPISDASVSDLREAVREKLLSCKLIESSSPINLAVVSSDSEKCVATCFQNASCSDLGTVVCSEQPGSALRSCVAGCEFKCKDGSGANTDLVECDGFEDCADGSDEAKCDSYYFSCKDGAKINAAFECDAENDCEDGSDEQGCPAPFTCADGQQQPAQYRCDAFPDCADESDEDGCGVLCQ